MGRKGKPIFGIVFKSNVVKVPLPGVTIDPFYGHTNLAVLCVTQLINLINIPKCAINMLLPEPMTPISNCVLS